MCVRVCFHVCLCVCVCEGVLSVCVCTRMRVWYVCICVCVCACVPSEHWGTPQPWCLRCGLGSVVKHQGPTVELSGFRHKLSLRSLFLYLLDINLEGEETEAAMDSQSPGFFGSYVQGCNLFRPFINKLRRRHLRQ